MVSIIAVVSVMIAKNSKGQHLQIQFLIDIAALLAPVFNSFLLQLTPFSHSFCFSVFVRCTS